MIRLRWTVPHRGLGYRSIAVSAGGRTLESLALLITDYLSGELVLSSPREEVRQAAARFLVESLGYPRETLAAQVSLAQDHREAFLADLVVTLKEGTPPFIVVEVAAPGSPPSQSVPPAVVESGAQYYFWFDGFLDDPRRGPISWGARYFQRHGEGFAPAPYLPHHHRPLKRRRRRAPTRHLCPTCGHRVELFCAIPCAGRCIRWACHWYGQLYCRTCQRSWPRPRPQGSKR